MKSKNPENDLVRVRFRIENERTKEIIAIRKICEKKIEVLAKKYGDSIKFSKIVLASGYPSGAPHI
tara:strand:+ start:512 stop:709 length:198 start_codon:yes stop_codon:yes gene_type:complete